MEVFEIKEETKVPVGARIIAIGVGGGGSNMIHHMCKERVKGIEYIVANTDAQALNNDAPTQKIQLGMKLTRGLGAGMKPRIGKESALESYDDLRTKLEGANIVFVAAGLGGGTGTGAAPIIAKIAKQIGALTIAVVTKPFGFEGQKRQKLALEGLEELKNEADCIIVILNEHLLKLIDPKLGIKESFKIVDSVLARAVSGTSGVILASGLNDINLDFADLRTVMSHRGLALMGIGEHHGENAAQQAMLNAIESPLLDNISINGAMGILVHFSIHPNFSLLEISAAMEVIHKIVDDNADVIFGTTPDEKLPVDFVKITLVATGFEKKVIETAEPKMHERMVIKPVAVANGTIYESVLDVPTFKRNQKD